MVAGAALQPSPAAAQEANRVLLYTGTTGFRHADAIEQGAPVVKTALEGAGYTVDWQDCNGKGAGANTCDTKNPAIFTEANLATFDAILLFNASSACGGCGLPGPLWTDEQKQAIMGFVQAGGGIAANHNATDMSAGAVTWDWWDGGPSSAVGSLMKGHAATDPNNEADVQVADHNHLATRDLPDVYEFGDEHYNFARSVRGTHHVLATLDERTYTPGGNAMGQDHPITWCKLYDGGLVDDGTGTPKPYDDGRVWVTGMGHFGSSYTAGGGNNELVKQIVGGVRWVAGEGRKSDCSGTVWSSFKRTTLVDDVNGPIGVDVAADGKVYWTEIGPNPGYESEGYLKVHDPAGAPNNKTTVITIPTRADHGNSEDGVLGMSLEPGFDLADPEKRDVFIYYSPRNPDWPTTGNEIEVGYNQISRFTLAADGTSAVPDSERVILRVPKAKISGSPSGFPSGPTDSGPGHVGGAGLDFDSDGNLYLGVGDDVSPNAPGHNAYPPLDYRAKERWDARKTSANSADLRGKVLRIHPELGAIPADAEPGAGSTYTIPAGNMFPPGTANTRPEIFAMGFRQPFTVHTDPDRPGRVVVGEYCHDNGSNGANRAPAGVCEWNLVDKPSFQGWPFCVGDNAPANTTFRWNYASNASTGQQYDCSLGQLPTDLAWAPDGQTGVAPTFDGLETIPGPATEATVWRKYPGATGGQSPADFGDLTAGGMSPITGPVYRYDAETAGSGAFPPYYDGAWFIANRGSGDGFWKEVRLRKDDGKMLRVNDWTPAAQTGMPSTSYVIPTQFGPDGALYMARWSESCCRNQLGPDTKTQLIKVEFAVADRCDSDTEAPNVDHALAGREHPTEPDTFFESATLTLAAGDLGCAGLKNVEYKVNGAAEWQRYGEPVVFEPGTYTVEYRATDRNDNVSPVGSATFHVVETNDAEAPVVTPTLSGTEVEDGRYATSATLDLDAEDAVSPIRAIEYRDNQAGDWTKAEFEGDALTASTEAEFDSPGFHYVEFRATDDAGNTSAIAGVSFSVLAGCSYTRTDWFDGTALDARWLRHVRSGGTPETGDLAPTVADGTLLLPTNDLELDGSNTTTAAGPVNFVGQDLPALGDDWQVETQFTVTHTGGWQGVGLMLWQADNNFFRSTVTHNLGSGSIFIEQSKDNPTTPEGARVQSGGNPTILPEKGPVTIRMRYARVDGADTVQAQYRILAPESAATDGWEDFPAMGGGNDLAPNGGSRRDAAGSRVGLYAGGNFPGTTGNHPYPGTPASVEVDYFRVTPDTVTGCPDQDVTPPETSAALDPAQPGPGGTYNGSVEVQISAADESGVEQVEYSVDGGDWQQENGDATSVKVSLEGDHVVRYRASDTEGNLSAPEEVAFTIADVRDVYAEPDRWDPDALSVDFGDTVTWHFDDPLAGRPHDLWLVAPGTDPETEIQQVSGPVFPGGSPVPYTFRKAGTWTFVCQLHSVFTGGRWTGMVGSVDVGDEVSGAGPDPGPGPGAGGAPSPPPGPGTTNPIVDPGRIGLPATATKLNRLPKRSLRSFLKRGLKVTSRCESGLRGRVQVRLSRRQARKLGLRRATTLASRAVRCGAGDRLAVRLEAPAKLKRKLRRARRSVIATVQITMGSGAAATTDTRRLALTKRR